LRPLILVLSLFVTAPLLAQDFYEARYQSGVADFNRGAFARAIDELRVAAFGRVEDVPKYATTEIYLAIANHQLNRLDDARLSAIKVLQAEQISRVYATLPLPVDVRSQFETVLPLVVSRDLLESVPSFARFAGRATTAVAGAPLPTQQPRQVVPTPTRMPNVAVTAKPDNRDAERQSSSTTAPPRPAPQQQQQQQQQQQPPPAHLQSTTDYGRLALDRFNAGDEDGARQNAALALAADDSNANAHAALAQLGRAHNAWSDVAEHYAVVRTRRRLTDDEVADYFVALVKTGRVADAAGLRRTLPASVLTRPEVQAAIATIDPRPATPLSSPQPPAPRPVQRATPAIVTPPSPLPSAMTTAQPPMSRAQAAGEQIANADRLLTSGNIVGARTELRRIAMLPDLQRSDRLPLARTLSQAALYAESSAQYRKAYPLRAGEESHMFYEAVNRYQLGDFTLARQLITRALPALPQTTAILAYRDRILAQQ